MTAPLTDFTGYDLAVGDVTGLRRFGVDDYGRLHAIAYTAFIWRPGENVASCAAKQHAEDCPGKSARSFLHIHWDVSSCPPCQAAQTCECPSCPEPLSRPDECGCGFYAYTNSTCLGGTYGNNGAVNGVISGYGKTVLGSKGFRCEKAEIVGLHVRKTAANRDRVTAQLRRLYDVPIYANKHELLNTHPLSEPPVISPDSDPDFWTRP